MAVVETKKLNMTFSLTDNRTKMLSLADPRDDVSASDVSSFMENCVNKDAMLVGTARLAGAKSAAIVTTSTNVLF